MLRRWRGVLIALAGARAVLSIVAIPLAPVLWDDHVAILTFLRPAKEVLLFGGYKLRAGDVDPLVLVLAALPLHLFAVWVFYGLARAYRDELEDAELPGVAGRLLPRSKIDDASELVRDRGWPVVFVGRLAIMPSTIVAAAAGATGMQAGTFLIADGAGAVVSLAVVIGAGYALGEAREQAGPWLTIGGAVVLLGLLTVLGWKLRGHRWGAKTRRRRGRR